MVVTRRTWGWPVCLVCLARRVYKVDFLACVCVCLGYTCVGADVSRAARDAWGGCSHVAFCVVWMREEGGGRGL